MKSNDEDGLMPGPSAEEFGRHIRCLRYILGLDIEQLASRSALDRTVIESTEAGEVDPSMLDVRALARGLGMSCGTMFRLWEMGRLRSLSPTDR